MGANEQRSNTVVETLAYMFSTLGTDIWAQIGRGKLGLVPLTVSQILTGLERGPGRELYGHNKVELEKDF